MNQERFDVIIVGYGPVGATLANLLGQAGHRVAVVDRFNDVFEQPRAINVDQEALRTWQHVGLADEITHGLEPHTGTDFVGADGKLIKYLYSAPPPYPLGWPANLMFVQPDAERILRRGVQRFANVTEYLGYDVAFKYQDEEGVTVALTDAAGCEQLRGTWLVACDGANSSIRRSLRISQEDLGFSEWWLVVDAWLRHETPLPQRTTQFCFPEHPGAYVVGSGNLRRWEMKLSADEDLDGDASSENVRQRLSFYVDPDAIDIWRSAVYHFDARIAEHWRRGRVFLAGDAAHQMPPFLGQGLCSGIRDAFNLWWKLDRVLRSESPAELLESYQQERRPHIRVLTEITKSLGEIVAETDPIKAARRDRRLRAQIESGEMETVRQNLIPPLKAGFLDPNDRSGLAGAIAVQPTLERGGGRHRSDDLAPGLRLLSSELPTPELSAALDRTGVTTLPVGHELVDVDDTFSAFAAANRITSVLVRPDGYVWGGYRASEQTLAAVHRLERALRTGRIDR